jgi:hypothetical protein
LTHYVWHWAHFDTQLCDKSILTGSFQDVLIKGSNDAYSVALALLAARPEHRNREAKPEESSRAFDAGCLMQAI